MHKLANELIEAAVPTLEKLANDSDDIKIHERELDCVAKIVKTAYCLYSIDYMKKKMGMYDNNMSNETIDGAMPMAEKKGLFDNPKKMY